jgi:hypothetical protein
MKRSMVMVCVLLGAACTSERPASQKTNDGGHTEHDASGIANLPRDGAVRSQPDAAVSTAPDAALDAALDAAQGDRDGASSSASGCGNGLKDGDETDIDCGGAACGTCLSGRTCAANADCLSGECAAGRCTCIPLTACPATACGVIRHCGQELDCGACASGVCYENQCCAPRKCKADECGVISDGCGATLRCGDESCCKPRSCEHPSLAQRCGDFDDRCGGGVTCACSDPDAQCYLGECCVPKTCQELGGGCGSVLSNGCGGTLSCACSGGETCYQGQCCTPLTDCSTWVGPGCGQLDNGCGGSFACGCSAGQQCNGGTCCTPTGCPAGNAGDACGATVSNGCGGTQSCGCAGGVACTAGTCCAPQTCSEQGLDHRCGTRSDGCSASLWCGCGQSSGMRVTRRANCGSSCADTLAAVNDCTAGAAIETLEQTAGWDFSTGFVTDPCNATFGFSPNWSVGCASGGFQVDAQGFVFLDVGTHCFSITGDSSCGSLYFVTTPDTFTGWENLPESTVADAVTGGSVACFDITVGDYYPLRWHYTQTSWLADFHVNYCPGGAGNCAPLPSYMPFPALP